MATLVLFPSCSHESSSFAPWLCLKNSGCTLQMILGFESLRFWLLEVDFGISHG